MSKLTFVRHGQATAFSRNSDRLTTLGEQQAHHLGESWATQGIRLSALYCGTLERQRRTAEIACSHLPHAPEIVAHPGWNEYDATGITTHLADLLASRDPAFALLRETFEQNRASENRNKHFQRMFERLTSAWLDGEIRTAHVETAVDFFKRVEDALNVITSNPQRNRHIAVFTSGGVIGRVTQLVTKAPPRTALELNWRVRNCSATEFLYSAGQLSLDLFNSVSHLPQAMVTYR